MRAILSRWSMMLAAVTCVTLVASTGCKSGLSMPGSDWLSWAKRPSATSLAANQYPQKPSANALPNPSATTNPQSAYPGFGAANYAANQSGGTPGYNTGPYSTAGLSSAAANRARLAANSYPNSGSSQGQASPPYQSPYASQSTAQNTSNPYAATADSRNSYANGYSNAASRNSYPTTPASGGLSAGQMRGGASDPYAGQAAKSAYPTTAPASYPQTQSYSSTPQPYGASPSAPGQWVFGNPSLRHDCQP